ncbi:hypothetical protein ACFW1A_22645 [Kitasatospora sp. NPDC058965]|uniref:hypothetical protein n=1 Tax=Kitasatospora sp. NPDC058965 TaxID=3346682 RepID=UPI0036ADA461
MPDTTRRGRPLPTALALLVLAVLLQLLHGWAFDHWVLEPTRHCHHQGAVPALCFAASGTAFVLTVAALVGAVRGRGRALAVLLLVLLALLLAYDALALLGDFAPGVHDPFHCGE